MRLYDLTAPSVPSAPSSSFLLSSPVCMPVHPLLSTSVNVALDIDDIGTDRRPIDRPNEPQATSIRNSHSLAQSLLSTVTP